MSKTKPNMHTLCAKQVDKIVLLEKQLKDAENYAQSLINSPIEKVKKLEEEINEFKANRVRLFNKLEACKKLQAIQTKYIDDLTKLLVEITQ